MKSQVGNQNSIWFLIPVFIQHQYFIEKHGMTTLYFHIFHGSERDHMLILLSFYPPIVESLLLLYHLFGQASWFRSSAGCDWTYSMNILLKRRAQFKPRIYMALGGRKTLWEMEKCKSRVMQISLIHSGDVVSFTNEYSPKSQMRFTHLILLPTSTDSYGA